MKTKLYSKHNFHNNTFCIWKEVLPIEIENLKISHTSKSGSGYIFLDTGVYRISNHWGRVSNCRWRLIPLNEFKNQNKTIAFAEWKSFLSNDEKAKLFYISVDFENKSASFNHVLDGKYTTQFMARNASETTKYIQIITEIFKDATWSKYLKFDDYDNFQKEIINKILTENKSWLQIKKDYL